MTRSRPPGCPRRSKSPPFCGGNILRLRRLQFPATPHRAVTVLASGLTRNCVIIQRAVCHSVNPGTDSAMTTFLSRLPASRITPAMEAGDCHNPVLLNLEEYSVGEAPHSRTATAPVDDWELQWMFRYCLNRGRDRQRETLPKLREYILIPCPRLFQVRVCLR